jgi:hypothetical protein
MKDPARIVCRNTLKNQKYNATPLAINSTYVLCVREFVLVISLFWGFETGHDPAIIPIVEAMSCYITSRGSNDEQELRDSYCAAVA